MQRAALTAALGAVLMLAAALFDGEPLYVPGAALVLLAVVSTLWVRAGARAARVQRTLTVRRVVEDEPVTATIVVRGGPLALAGTTLADPLLDAPVPVPSGGRAGSVRIDVRFSRRGRRTLAPPSIVVRDPLGLSSRTVEGEGNDELLVLPRIEPVTTLGGRDGGHALGRAARAAGQAAEVEIDGLRPHRIGSPASRIHWPTLARGVGLMERHLRPEGDARPLIVLDPRGAASGEDVDAAVRAAASLCVHLARQGGCAILLPGERRPVTVEAELAGWPHVHARLALVRDDARPAGAVVLARDTMVLYVSARASLRLPTVLVRCPARRRVLVVPQPLAARRASFTVAGCLGYELRARSARGGGQQRLAVAGAAR
jgi:uncharacterized protein (DUF58 family)